VTFAAIAERVLGKALPAPIDHGDRKAALARIVDHLEIFLDELGPAREHAERPLAPRRRIPPSEPQSDAIRSPEHPDHRTLGSRVGGDRDQLHRTGGGPRRNGGRLRLDVRVTLGRVRFQRLLHRQNPFLHVLGAGHQAARNPGSDHMVDRRMSLKGGYAMRTFDLAPLYRSTVGFDRLFSLLDQAPGFESAPSYPPYNIERTGENAYRVTVAVAGFAEPELSLEVKENALTIRGEKQAKQSEKSGEVLYQGIAARAFERRFQLAEHVEVKGASLENGLLHVDLVRELPETMKPRSIPINGSAK